MNILSVLYETFRNFVNVRDTIITIRSIKFETNMKMSRYFLILSLLHIADK